MDNEVGICYSGEGVRVRNGGIFDKVMKVYIVYEEVSFLG